MGRPPPPDDVVRIAGQWTGPQVSVDGCGKGLDGDATRSFTGGGLAISHCGRFERMTERWRTNISTPSSDGLRFAGGWLFLNMVPYLPALVSPLPLSPYFPLSVEVLVLVTVVVYGSRAIGARVTRLGVGAAILAVFIYEVYDAVVYTAFQRNGILYEDLQFADNLTYFAFDVGSWRLLLAGGAGIIGVAGLTWMVDRSIRAVRTAGYYGGCRMALLVAHLFTWPLVVVIGPALQWGTPNLTYQTTSEQVRIRTPTTKALSNIRASVRLNTMLDSLGGADVDSTYFAYDELTLERPPSVYLFAVESYGSVLDRHPRLRGPYRRVLRRTETELRRAGWWAASARLEAPVQGGRSWLAIASILTGVRVDRQLVYNRFQERPDSVPHLVRFLNRQGYKTVALQPFTFSRPGLPLRNLYNFDVTLYRDDLQYRGPSYGLADAPDQYSLNFAHQSELASAEPFFLFFETVSSHALWNYGLPPYLPDWRLFNERDGATADQKKQLKARGTSPTEFLPDSVTAPRIYDQPTPERYLQHVTYDLRVIRDYLIDWAPDGSIVVLLGDHQPPLFETADTTVPLHILSTDSTIVQRVREFGLTSGFRTNEERPTLRQEGLYSFLIRLLDGRAPSHGRNPSAEGDTTRIPFRPRGVSPSLLVR